MNTFATYITPDEFKFSPTAIDTANLDQENIGNAAAQLSVLTALLRRASRWADNICKQPLYAKTQTELKAISPTRDYRLVIHPNCTPLVGLTSVRYRRYPSDTWSDVVMSSDVQQFETWFEVYRQLNPFPVTPTNRLLVEYTYTSGFSTSVLTANSIVGATTLSLQDATGLVAGTGFTVGVGSTAEYVTVQSVVGNVVTLTAATTLAHTTNDVTSSVPDDIRQAVIMLAGFLIRERGSMAVTMNETTLTSSSTYAKSDDVKLAARLLGPYMRIVSS
jgi:hypothetical protein